MKVQNKYDYEALRRLLDKYTSMHTCMKESCVSRLFYDNDEDYTYDTASYKKYVESIYKYELHITLITAALSDKCVEKYSFWFKHVCEETRKALNF